MATMGEAGATVIKFLPGERPDSVGDLLARALTSIGVKPVVFGPVLDVFTTLTRQGLPLVRYRTGDLARIRRDPCPCGTVLKRLDRVQGRIEAGLRLQQGLTLTMAALDEVLFLIAGVLNFSAEVVGAAAKDQLHFCLQVCAGAEERVAREVVAVLRHTEPVALFRNRALAVGSITFNTAGWLPTGTGKRRIKDSRHLKEKLAMHPSIQPR